MYRQDMFPWTSLPPGPSALLHLLSLISCHLICHPRVIALRPSWDCDCESLDPSTCCHSSHLHHCQQSIDKYCKTRRRRRRWRRRRRRQRQRQHCQQSIYKYYKHRATPPLLKCPTNGKENLLNQLHCLNCLNCLYCWDCLHRLHFPIVCIFSQFCCDAGLSEQKWLSLSRDNLKSSCRTRNSRNPI